MSRTLNHIALNAARAAALVVATILPASAASAQSALGTPFIGRNHLSYQMAEQSRTGGAELTRVYGLAYGRRLTSDSRPVQVSLVSRLGMRPLDEDRAGVMEFASSVGVSHDIAALPGLSVAASAGAEFMLWGTDTDSGRIRVAIPVTGGMSYDIKIGEAMLSPFATASIARNDDRTYVNDVQVYRDREWDTRFSQGVSLRVNRVVLTSTRIVGEKGLPNHSRWTFAAGISY